MRSILLISSVCAAVFSSQPVNADPVKVALFGDWPYGKVLFDNMDLLITSLNNDASLKWVIHVGDIHSGSQPCTGADLTPLPATANPGYNQKIFAAFNKINHPVVYTPGDNEWTDCHKAKEGASGAPLNELVAVRTLFFSVPGLTLGATPANVVTQAKVRDPYSPGDAAYVENVMWEDSKILFLTVNMPGSNNDTLSWETFEDVNAHRKEIALRNVANNRWLDRAFSFAKQHGSKAIVLGLQADMFDPEALVTGGDGLNAYTPFVQHLADLTVRYGGPVLLVNGDSHVFGKDKPLADPQSATGQIHHTGRVSNLTRITVQGSTNAPAEWIKLTVDPSAFDPFAVEKVAYCSNPSSPTCQ